MKYTHVVAELDTIQEKCKAVQELLTQQDDIQKAINKLDDISTLSSWALVETERTAGTYQPSSFEQTLWAGICSTWACSVGNPRQSPSIADYQYFDGFSRGLLVLAIIFHRVPHDLVDDVEYLITLAAFITSEAIGSEVSP